MRVERASELPFTVLFTMLLCGWCCRLLSSSNSSLVLILPLLQLLQLLQELQQGLKESDTALAFTGITFLISVASFCCFIFIVLYMGYYCLAFLLSSPSFFSFLAVLIFCMAHLYGCYTAYTESTAHDA
ncbi:hypothetical protein ACQKWADRAFT_301859 [Trichoderma austrokoningii]